MGLFSQKPSNHINGVVCAKCSKDILQKIITIVKKKLLTSLEAQEKYIKKFEHFNESKEEIPFEIKTIVACIKDKIKDETTSFSKPFDFSNYEYFPIKFEWEKILFPVE